MTLKGIYVDDEEDFSDSLSDDRIVFKPVGGVISVSKMASEIVSTKPDAVVLDYRLDSKQNGKNSENDYRAGVLAQFLREKALDEGAKDFPIILVSSEDKIKKFFSPDRTAHDLFDDNYQKGSLSDDKRKPNIVNQIVSLAIGYGRIAEEKTNPLKLFGIPDDQSYVFKETDLVEDIQEAKAAHIAAHAILVKLIRRTGLLLRPGDIFARLGMKHSSGTRDNEWLFKYFEESGLLYTGVFGDGWKRVWRHRFDKWSRDLFGKTITSIPADERVAFLNSKLGWKLEPAPSPWSNSPKELLAVACVVCRRPVEIRNSVTVQDDLQPKFLEKERVCFDCIEADRHVNRTFPIKIAKDDLPLVSDIENGKIKRAD